MTKAELESKLTAAIGDTAYGKEIIDRLVSTYEDADKKYGQDALDRLHDRMGMVKFWMDRDQAKGETVKAANDAERIAVIEKAIAALK